MNTRGLHLSRAKPVAAALLASLALAFAIPAATAQEAPGGVGDFRLPPGPERPPAPVQGPVDDQVPEVRPTRTPPPEPAQPAATASPTASASASPASPATAPVRREPAPRAGQPAPRAAPEGAAAAPDPLGTPAPAEPLVPPAGTVSAPAVPEATVSATDAPPVPTDDTDGLPGWLVAALAIAAFGGIAVWYLRRGAKADGEPSAPELAGPAPLARPASPAVPAPDPDPSPPATPLAAPAPASEAAAVDFTLEAHHLSRSLVFVTLAYRLTVTNRGAAPTGPLQVAADLSSAHASRSREAQLRPQPGELEQRHALGALGPGESVTLTGDLRLPVAAILAIQQGAAQLFVPLARFMLTGDGAEPRTFVYVIGLPGEAPGAGLRPFRIDAMPGVFRELDQREIAIAA